MHKRFFFFFSSYLVIGYLITFINRCKVDYFTATNGKKLAEKFQNIEEKLHDMQRDLQNFQSRTIGALERLDFSKKPRKSLQEIEDDLMNDIVR